MTKHFKMATRGLVANLPVTISIALVRGMLGGGQAHGLPIEACLKDAGIAPEFLERTGARVTANQYVALMAILIERLDDESLGFMSRRLKRGSFALTARASLTAPNLASAIRRIARTFNLLQDDVLLEPAAEGDLAGLALRVCDPSSSPPTFLHEALLRVFWRLLAWLVGGRLHAERFDFVFQRPPHAGHYGEAFPAPLAFAQPRSAFWFAAHRLQDPVCRDEADYHSFIADSVSEMLLPRRDLRTFTARVRNRLRHARPRWPGVKTTAAELHVSASTLQRRLAAEGTSYQTIKDEMRRDLAVVQLDTGGRTLSEIAFELGFSTSSAFQRAFKLWTGSPPLMYLHRRRASQGPAAQRIGRRIERHEDQP